MKKFSRRKFVGQVGVATAAFSIVPRNVLGGTGYQAPSDTVNVAGIGVGAQGGGDIQQIATPDVAVTRLTLFLLFERMVSYMLPITCIAMSLKAKVGPWYNSTKLNFFTLENFTTLLLSNFL